jgi:acyl-coenzyme A thioesterase PaaI-like protein
MGFVPADPQFEQCTRASFAKQGAMAYLGALPDEVGPGRVEISLPFRPELAQQHGFFHAGIISTIADTAADGERAIAVGEVLRSGRTLTVCRLDAFVEKQGRRVHCATGVQTLIALAGRDGVKD